MLEEHHRHAVGLLPGRAGGRPERELPLGGPTRHEVGDHGPQRLERRAVAEERRLVRHHGAQHVLLERRIDALANAVDERLEAGDLPLLDDRHQAGDHEVVLRLVDAHARPAAQ